MRKKTSIALIMIFLLILIQTVGAQTSKEAFEAGLQSLQYYTSGIDKLLPGLKPLETAISQFELSISENVNVDEAILMIALIYQELDNPKKAMDYLSYYLMRNPDHGWVKVLEGDLWYQLGDQTRALAAYEQALANEELAQGYYGLGTIKLSRGETLEGIQALAKCVELAPDFTEARMQLATAYFNNSAFDEALEHFELVVLYDSYVADAHYYLSLLYERNGNLEKAQHARDMALSYGSSYASVLQ